MRITVNSNDLRDALSKILTVIDRKNSRPILTNCLVTVKEGLIELMATDLEVTAKIILKTHTEQTGSFCINTKNFFEIIRELPDAEAQIDINQNKNLLNLSCKNINYSLLITSSEEYPHLNFEISGKPFELSSKDVLKIINKTFYAVSSDETRINLNGIFLQYSDSKLRTVAIDGHRLALIDIHNFETENHLLEDGIIVPRKGILELKKMAESFPNDNITFSLDESFLCAKASDDYFLSVRLIAREYPKYQTILPSKTMYSMTVDRDALYNAIKRIRILSNEKTNGIKLSIAPNLLTISANHQSLGHAQETIQVDYTGEKIEIGFNAKYMSESIGVLEVNEITFEFNNELSPVIIRSNEFSDFLGIIMPLKL